MFIAYGLIWSASWEQELVFNWFKYYMLLLICLGWEVFLILINRFFAGRIMYQANILLKGNLVCIWLIDVALQCYQRLKNHFWILYLFRNIHIKIWILYFEHFLCLWSLASVFYNSTSRKDLETHNQFDVITDFKKLELHDSVG